jgi:S1-C subfamily serine protease
LLGIDGTVRGIGSLMVQEKHETHTHNMNLFVPIDLLKPILDDLLHFGRVRRTPRPWLGLLATEYSGLLAVIQVIEAGPADRAGIRTGDIILEVASEPVEDLPSLFRTIWRLGEAGVNVPLTIARDGGERVLQICSGDRYNYQKSPHFH